MEVIPAIDLLEGRCVRLYKGDYALSQVYSHNPVETAKMWADQGATRLHLVDLDGAKAGKIVNLSTIEAITSSVSISVEVGGGIRDSSSVIQLFNLGVQWAILGTVAVEQPDLVQGLCEQFPQQIIVGIDARNGLVATRGWLETSQILAPQLATQMQELGAAAIIYTDINRDGTLQGPNLQALRDLVSAISIPVIASGGVGSVTDLLTLLSLEHQGVTGVIVGKALYTGDISLPEALRAIGPGRIQDIPPSLDFSSFA
jgi:phosphoribosylformimino-5-aminoimidazole carboxamide ribotide isomerase